MQPIFVGTICLIVFVTLCFVFYRIYLHPRRPETLHYDSSEYATAHVPVPHGVIARAVEDKGILTVAFTSGAIIRLRLENDENSRRLRELLGHAPQWRLPRWSDLTDKTLYYIEGAAGFAVLTDEPRRQ